MQRRDNFMVDSREKQIDLCLVSPPSRASTMTVPAGLLYLQSWLKKENINSRIIDIKLGRPNITISPAQKKVVKERIVEELKKYNPRYVGITCFTTDFWDVVDLSRIIKRKLNPIIIVGGVHANIKPDDFFFEDSLVDIAVSGDGQQPLVEIIRNFSHTKTLEGITGVTYRNGSGEIISQGVSTFQNWDKMPNPDYSQLNMQYYTQPHTGVIRTLFASGIHIFTTIGCPFQCTFCGNRNKHIKFRPFSKVLDEIEDLVKVYKIDSFYIQDDTFCLDKLRVKKFVEGLNESGLKMFWGMETRVNLINEELIKMIAGAGCIQVDFGVESGSDDALRRMKKGVTTAQTLKAFELCKKFKIRTYANIMFNTPEETLHDVELTKDLLKKIRPTRIGLALTVPFPGTEIYEKYINPPLSKEEYKLFSDPNLFFKVIDPRFYLARHELDLTKLRIKTQAAFSGLRAFMDCTLNRKYWEGLLRSKRKGQYLKAIFITIFFERVNKIIGVFRNWME